MQGALKVSDQDEDLSGHGLLLQNILLEPGNIMFA